MDVDAPAWIVIQAPLLAPDLCTASRNATLRKASEGGDDDPFHRFLSQSHIGKQATKSCFYFRFFFAACEEDFPAGRAVPLAAGFLRAPSDLLSDLACPLPPPFSRAERRA